MPLICFLRFIQCSYGLEGDERLAGVCYELGQRFLCEPLCERLTEPHLPIVHQIVETIRIHGFSAGAFWREDVVCDGERWGQALELELVQLIRKHVIQTVQKVARGLDEVGTEFDHSFAFENALDFVESAHHLAIAQLVDWRAGEGFLRFLVLDDWIQGRAIGWCRLGNLVQAKQFDGFGGLHTLRIGFRISRARHAFDEMDKSTAELRVRGGFAWRFSIQPRERGIRPRGVVFAQCLDSGLRPTWIRGSQPGGGKLYFRCVFEQQFGHERGVKSPLRTLGRRIGRAFRPERYRVARELLKSGAQIRTFFGSEGLDAHGLFGKEYAANEFIGEACRSITGSLELNVTMGETFTLLIVR